MNHVVCAVFDSAVGAYGRPFFVAARGAAIRSFMDEVNRKGSDSAIAAHPDDYTLYQLGTWNDNSGEFEFMAGGHEVLARGKDCVAPVE